MNRFIALLCAVFPAISSAAYSPTPTETAVFEAVLRDEFNAFLEGGETVIGSRLGLARAPAVAVAMAYARGASFPYPASMDNALLVSGAVASIERDARGKHMAAFATPQPVMVRAELPLGMSPAASLTLVCGKMRVVDSSPTFSDCQDAAVVGRQAVAALKADVANFYEGKPTEASVSRMAINVAFYASQLPADHGCPDEMAQCRQHIEAATASASRSQALRAVVRRFQDASVDLSPYEDGAPSAD